MLWSESWLTSVEVLELKFNIAVVYLYCTSSVYVEPKMLTLSPVISTHIIL